ncbi:MAG: response regulator transcription factor [Anaerolineales bacterium]|jgi:two-component system response regulator NreC
MPDEHIRVLLVDDHQVLRDGLRLLLESEKDIVIVGEASNGKQAIEKAKQLIPDVIVMDLGLPDISGIDVIKSIHPQLPDTHTVVLSMHTQKDFVLNAIGAGAEGYVPKSSTHESLLDAIRTVHAGERYLHPLAANALVETYIKEEESSEEQLFQDLTEREQEVLRLSARGYTSREIGEKLIISPKTVDTYRQRAFDKLGIEHRNELIRFAMKAGILDDMID